MPGSDVILGGFHGRHCRSHRRSRRTWAARRRRPAQAVPAARQRAGDQAKPGSIGRTSRNFHGAAGDPPGRRGAVPGTVPREGLRIVQTPQAFNFAALLDAHRRAQAAGREDFTDDAALAEWAGLKVATFEGEAGNVKLTTNEDFARAQAAQLAVLSDVRTGFGFDVHQFADGDYVWLGGLRIPHTRGVS